ncbi:hypothetical protein M404DRAFT_11014 [Pisolithus tinctorius Marx 270]|uniref:Uncharacterized protein n=1 Tax=Pisolithus tinctorius Marx 270 TaxID=870435 RepID=A0A0C3NLB0_PISTI|nr:hypothetical protein M404DRAFT_11014 [Pisolithus tinctorius Marx 270]
MTVFTFGSNRKMGYLSNILGKQTRTWSFDGAGTDSVAPAASSMAPSPLSSSAVVMHANSSSDVNVPSAHTTSAASLVALSPHVVPITNPPHVHATLAPSIIPSEASTSAVNPPHMHATFTVSPTLLSASSMGGHPGYPQSRPLRNSISAQSGPVPEPTPVQGIQAASSMSGHSSHLLLFPSQSSVRGKSGPISGPTPVQATSSMSRHSSHLLPFPSQSSIHGQSGPVPGPTPVQGIQAASSMSRHSSHLPLFPSQSSVHGKSGPIPGLTAVPASSMSSHSSHCNPVPFPSQSSIHGHFGSAPGLTSMEGIHSSSRQPALDKLVQNGPFLSVVSHAFKTLEENLRAEFAAICEAVSRLVIVHQNVAMNTKRHKQKSPGTNIHDSEADDEASNNKSSDDEGGTRFDPFAKDPLRWTSTFNNCAKAVAAADFIDKVVNHKWYKYPPILEKFLNMDYVIFTLNRQLKHLQKIYDELQGGYSKKQRCLVTTASTTQK